MAHAAAGSVVRSPHYTLERESACETTPWRTLSESFSSEMVSRGVVLAPSGGSKGIPEGALPCRARKVSRWFRCDLKKVEGDGHGWTGTNRPRTNRSTGRRVYARMDAVEDTPYARGRAVRGIIEEVRIPWEKVVPCHEEVG